MGNRVLSMFPIIAAVMFVLPILGQTKPAPFDPRGFLSSKVTYKERAPFTDAPLLSSIRPPNGCKPKFLYLVARHGARWPTTKRFEQMKNLEDVFKNATNLEMYPWMENWELPFEDGKGDLHPIGQSEMTTLARRLQKQYPQLLGGPYLKSKHFVRSTYKSRTIHSAEAFVKGLFGEDTTATADILWAPKGEDNLLRFFDSNAEYAARAEKNEDEFGKWVEGAIYPGITENIKKRIGFKEGALEASFADGIMTLCQTEATLFNKTDQGCALLSKDEIETLEWTNDSEDYFVKGPSEKLNCCIAKPLVDDLIYWLEVAAGQATESTTQTARLHFAHAETNYPLLCLLGIGSAAQALPKDQSRQSIPFPMVTKDRENRFWMSARIVPMGGNFVATLFDCEEGGGSPKVRFSWNEQIVPGHWCQGTECDLADVVKRLKGRAEEFGDCSIAQQGSCNTL